MALVSTLGNNMKIWEPFCLQAGSHNVVKWPPHCAGSCTNMKQKVGCQEIWSSSEREGLDLSAAQFVHLETLCLLRGRFTHWCLWVITLGTKGWKKVGMSTGMSCQGRCCMADIKSSWSGAVRWKSWPEMKGSNVFVIITYNVLLPVALIKLAK